MQNGKGFDMDGDGEDATTFGGSDCEDDNAFVYAAAIEIYYDGQDRNCDGLSDYDADEDGQDSADHGGLD